MILCQIFHNRLKTKIQLIFTYQPSSIFYNIDLDMLVIFEKSEWHCWRNLVVKNTYLSEWSPVQYPQAYTFWVCFRSWIFLPKCFQILNEKSSRTLPQLAWLWRKECSREKKIILKTFWTNFIECNTNNQYFK